MTFKKIFILFSAALFAVHVISAKDFEGTISMVKESYYDTSLYVFTIKGGLVRLDVKNSANITVQSLIIDSDVPKIIALSQNLKLFTIITLKKENLQKSLDFKVTSTANNKIIDGYKCTQWRVRNESLNTEVAYWIYESNINIFLKAVTLLCYTDEYKNLFEYFVQISPKPGYLPILTEEWTLLREEKSKTKITNITSKEVSSKVFQVPADYKLLRSQRN
jgi:hypothetical protein